MSAAAGRPEQAVMAERRIAASPEIVYRCISDFNEHHRHILPPSFKDLKVERGGVGAGTVITFATTTGGRTRQFRSEITEPEPGRVLVETDDANGTRSVFTVTPDAGGSRVRIENSFRVSPGITGIVERLIAPRILRSVLADELARLDAYSRSLEPRR